MDGFDDHSFSDPEKLYISLLFYNKDGIIEEGIDIQEETDGKFTLKVYKANKMLKTVQVGNADKLEEVIWDPDEEFKFDIP